MSFSRQLKDKAMEVWEKGYNHPFVQEIGKGTLEKEKFKFYLLQDYQYLIQYAKVYALAVVKADDIDILSKLTNVQHNILANEMQTHIYYMKKFNINNDQIQNTKASLYNRTYTANMLAVGQTKELVHILATIFPCAWVYSDYARRLKQQYQDKYENNYYKTWIDSYSSNNFEESFEWFYDVIDEIVATKTNEQKKEIEEIFISSVEFEYLFWDMAYKQEMSYLL
ncbi:thiaminase II [Mycoplasma sp. P36-A1]|uniref:thiaminase II n=1 Tax=Mycoplasma sp. P36-A1 TaxID=3252900 RepID=UPI003C2C98A7